MHLIRSLMDGLNPFRTSLKTYFDILKLVIYILEVWSKKLYAEFSIFKFAVATRIFYSSKIYFS